MNITVPAPEALHKPYANLLNIKATLDALATDLRGEAADLRRRIGTAMPSDDKVGRIQALLNGQPPVHSPTLTDELDAVLAKLRDVSDAQAEVGTRIRLEYASACRAVADSFSDEHRRLVRDMWRGIAAAAKARCEIQDIHRAFRLAGVKFDGIDERGDVVFGSGPVDRTTHLALELRNAARDGLIEGRDIPEVLR